MSRATLTDEAAMQAPASHGGIWMAVNGNRTPAVHRHTRVDRHIFRMMIGKN
jgi:hypothetical protein